jgi:hypothetical protein
MPGSGNAAGGLTTMSHYRFRLRLSHKSRGAAGLGEATRNEPF